MGDSSWPKTRPSLLNKVQAKDPKAWGDLVEIYAPLLQRYCRRKKLPPDTALDVAYLVLLKVRNGFVYHPEEGNFRSWLATVTYHEILIHWRQANRPDQGVGGEDGRMALDQAAAAPEDLDWNQVFNSRILEKALERVRPNFNGEQWAAFERMAFKIDDSAEGRQVVWNNEPAAKVAQDLHKNIGWAYQVKSRIMTKLEEEVLYLAEDLDILR